MSDCCIELIVSEETPVELQVCEQDQIGLEIKEQIVYGGGGIIPVGTKTIEVTENGTVTDDVTYYAAVEIDVDVPNTYEAGDEGKVVDDGALVSQSSTNITTNGTYDTTLNNEAIVAVPASAVDTGTKDITHNGNGQDVVGYAAVNVAVPNSYAAGDEGKVVSSGALVSQGSAEYTENGTYDTTLISSVEVAVPGDAPSGTKQIEITENGTNTENVAGYAYAEIEVAVPNSYASGDEGKVVDNGELVAQTSLGVNENGTYDTTLNNQVVVSVPNTYAAGDEGKVVSNGELVSQGSATYTSNNTYDTTLIDEVTVNVSGGGSPNLQTVSKTYTPTESQQTEQITPGTGYDGLAEVDVTVNAISSSYVGSGVTRRSSTDLSESGGTVTAPAGYYAESASKAVAAGTAGTPVATKGTVSNHSIDVTPSVTNSAGYVASETKTGTAVTVTASELVSGSETKTQNGTYNVTNLAELVIDVSSGGTTEPEPLDVDLVDYDGTLLYTYSKADFLALESLPANPSHTGLVAQGWNWTLADAKTYVTAHGTLVIGQSYRTDDGKSRFYISIPDGAYPDFELNLFVETGYNATVAWGDGNTDTVAGKASYSGISHTYNSSGDYLITVTCEGKLQFGCTGTNVSAFAPNAGYSYRGSFLKKVELSNNVTRIYRTAFLNAFALESISIPTSVENMRGDEFTSAANMFANAYALKGIVVPAGCPCIGGSMFTYSAVKYISLPKATFSVSNSPNGSFANTCGCLRKLTFPDGMSSSVAMNITNSCSVLKRFVVMGDITSLGSDYFKNNASLPRLDIPSTVTSIAANAFNGNRGVREYHFHSTTPPTLSNTNAFGNQNNRGFTIYVPYSADHSVLNAYKTASNWSTYASNIQEESA